MAIFKLLLKYKCSLTPIENDSWFAMYSASFYNHVTLLKYMIDNNIGINTINIIGGPNSYTPLIGAISENNPQSVQILASCDKTDIDSIKCNFGNGRYTALECAALVGNGAVLRILLRALLKQHKISDWTSLMEASIDKRMEELRRIARSKSQLRRNVYVDPCETLLDDLIEKGLIKKDFEHIASTLRYNIPALMKLSGDKFAIPNNTIIVGHNYPCRAKKSASKSKSNSNSNVVGRWEVGEILGTGAFGNVFKGTDIYDKRKVALKYISINKLSQNSKSRKTRIASFIMNELETVELVNHKNVIKLLGYNLNVDNNSTMLLVFEYAHCGELYQFLSINKYFNNDIAKTYFEQILDALEACHLMGVIHRDLKPQNILLDSKYQVKVSDFGLSTYDNDVANKNTLYVGTRGYMSPEIASPMIQDWDENDNPIYKEIDSSCDVFSLGVILWQLLNGIESIPFDEAIESDPKYIYISQKEFNLFWKCHYNCRIVKNLKSPTSSINIEEKDIQNLLLQMFAFIPDNRISINDIRKHKWYYNVKGYNSNQESQIFFQDIMQKIHQQLELKQTLAIQSMTNNAKFKASGINYSNTNTTQIAPTTFEFVKLRQSFFSQVSNYKIINPLITGIIIGDYGNSKLPNVRATNKDYQNIIDSFNGAHGYSVVVAAAASQTFENVEDNYTLKCFTSAGVVEMKENDAKSSNYYKSKWNSDEIEDFNDRIKDEWINNDNGQLFDSLIYIISCHGDGKSTIYDSNGEDFSLSHIYYQFNNKNCKSLRNKPKIYLFDIKKNGSIDIENKSMHGGNNYDKSQCNYQQDEKMDVSAPDTVATVAKQKYLHANITSATYTEDTHYRKIFANSGQQPISNKTLKCLKNGSIFIQCFSEIVKNIQVANLSDVLIKTRANMARKLNLTQSRAGGGVDAIVLGDDSTMPYDIEFGKRKVNDYETKMDEYSNSILQQTVCTVYIQLYMYTDCTPLLYVWTTVYLCVGKFCQNEKRKLLMARMKK